MYSFILGLLMLFTIKAQTKLKTTVKAETVEISKKELNQIISLIGNRLQIVRYMEQNCIDFKYDGWEDYPTIKCNYTVTDKKSGQQKKATVIMLNPSAEKLSRWIITTCKIVKGTLKISDAKILLNHIMKESHAQYPVAGIVYEDILPNDGLYEIYCFRDGVAVEVKGVKHRDTIQPSFDKIQASLYGKVENVLKYARISSTTPNQYIGNGGNRDVGNNNKRKIEWLYVSRELYQKAWDSNVNELIIAWAKENLPR